MTYTKKAYPENKPRKDGEYFVDVTDDHLCSEYKMVLEYAEGKFWTGAPDIMVTSFYEPAEQQERHWMDQVATTINVANEMFGAKQPERKEVDYFDFIYDVFADYNSGLVNMVDAVHQINNRIKQSQSTND